MQTPLSALNVTLVAICVLAELLVAVVLPTSTKPSMLHQAVTFVSVSTDTIKIRLQVLYWVSTQCAISAIMPVKPAHLNPLTAHYAIPLLFEL